MKSMTININKKTIIMSLMVILLLVVLVNVGIIIFTNQYVKKEIARIEEEKRPANLEITVIKDLACSFCFDLEPILQSLETLNVKITAKKEIELNTEEGQQLVSKFSIEKVPAFIVTGEIEKNEALKSFWQQIGEIKDDTFVFTKTQAPYVLTETGEIKGKIKVTYLTDKSCLDCYNISLHQNALMNLGVIYLESSYVDINSSASKDLVSKYKITLVPTIILEGDMKEYPRLVAAWPSVGTKEEDGVYVFREGVKIMGTYKDLSTGEVVKRQAPTPTNVNTNSQ